MSKYFDEETDNLVTSYILPLININFRTFGFHFKDSKILRSQDAVIVYLYPGCKEPYWENPYYQNDYDIDNTTHVIFSLPEECKEDIALFCEGKYSKMSQKTKEKIYKGSGLLYNKQIDKLVVTDIRLLALTKSPILKEWIRENYKLRIGENLELLRLTNKDIIYAD